MTNNPIPLKPTLDNNLENGIETEQNEQGEEQQKEDVNCPLCKIDVIDGIDGYMTLEQPFNLFLCRIPTNE